MGAYTGVGGSDLIDIMAGGIPDQSAMHWLEQKSQALQGSISGIGQAFFDRARSMYNMVSESQAVQILRNLKSKSDSVWNTGRVQLLHRIQQIQTAGLIMQRWVMAQPDLRQRYLAQTVEGYGDSYVNYHGNAVAEAHYDYRRVMSDVVMIDEDDEEKDFVVNHYFDLLAEGEQELTPFQKVDILNTWDRVKYYLEQGDEDPTSQYGSLL